jgi:hypothetical protein
VEREPSVDAARHRDRADVFLERHLDEAFGPEPGRIGARPAPAAFSVAGGVVS